MFYRLDTKVFHVFFRHTSILDMVLNDDLDVSGLCMHWNIGLIHMSWIKSLCSFFMYFLLPLPSQIFFRLDPRLFHMCFSDKPLFKNCDTMMMQMFWLFMCIEEQAQYRYPRIYSFKF